MNERIKELAHQADFIIKKHNGDEWRWGWIDPELNVKLEKFAELIVRECCDVLYDNEMGGYQVNYVLKEHFGVE